MANGALDTTFGTGGKVIIKLGDFDAAANQVLTNFGMKVFVSQPQTQRDGGNITYTASSIVFQWRLSR